jgi:aminoglycoside phosphotransferase family enzyme
VIETHMSWVFLTDRFAYKLKKPVRYPFLDFATVAARGHFCREEVRLNRRLAPEVYLGVVPVAARAGGGFELEGGGPVRDWLVKMIRLPEEKRLDRRIADGRLARSAIARVVERLVAFYRSRSPVPVASPAYRASFVEQVAATRAALVRPHLKQDPGLVGRLMDCLADYLARRGYELGGRASGSRIVEGHGDLRPEHVYLLDPVVVTDCLEFNRALRLLDPLDELAYLAMECERLGAPEVRRWLLADWVDATGDVAPPSLIAFYTAFRAYLRAAIALAHLDEPVVREPERWIARGRHYLALADAFAAKLG